ncbi:MAG: radical SAM protein [Candidatus Lokiarchaeota archaeon]|nr:radical SAM protein [Candidatus Lokiarchaeota archaeon]
MKKNSVIFISPRRCVPINENGTPFQKMRTNFCLPASVILGILDSAGFETYFIDAAADGFDNYDLVNKNSLAYGLSSDIIVEKIAEIGSRYILITSMFTTEQYLVDELVNTIRYKLPECIIIIGGIHASAKPEWHLDDSKADYIVIGEGEETIINLLKALDNGSNEIEKIKGLCFKTTTNKIIKTHNQSLIKTLKYNWAIKDILFRLDGSVRYIEKNSRKCPVYVDPTIGENVPSIALYPSRGCPINCDYCTATNRDGKKVRHIGAQKLWDYFYQSRKDLNVQIFYNQSDTFGIVKDDWEFLQKVSNYREKTGDRNFLINNPNAFFLKSFFIKTPDGISIDNDKLNLIQKSGINIVTIAIETFSQRYNKKIDWSIMGFDTILNLCQEIKRKGMKIDIYMVYGYPGQEIEEFNNDYTLIKRLAPYVDWINWHFCTLFPDTNYYTRLVHKGLLSEKSYREAVNNGYSFFFPVDRFNFSKISTDYLKAKVTDFGPAWI